MAQKSEASPSLETNPLDKVSLHQLTQLIKTFHAIGNLIDEEMPKQEIAGKVTALRASVEAAAELPDAKASLVSEPFEDYQTLMWPSFDEPEQNVRLALLTYDFAHQEGLAADIPGDSKAELKQAIGEYVFPGGLQSVVTQFALEAASITNDGNGSKKDFRDLLVAVTQLSNWDQVETFYTQNKDIGIAHEADRAAFADRVGLLADVSIKPSTFGRGANGHFSPALWQTAMTAIMAGKSMSTDVMARLEHRRTKSRVALVELARGLRGSNVLFDARLATRSGLANVKNASLRTGKAISTAGVAVVGAIAAVGTMAKTSASRTAASIGSVIESAKAWASNKAAARAVRPVKGLSQRAQKRVFVAFLTVYAVGLAALGTVAVRGSSTGDRDTEKPRDLGPAVSEQGQGKHNPPALGIITPRTTTTMGSRAPSDWVEQLQTERVTEHNARRLVDGLRSGKATALLDEMVSAGTNSPLSVLNGPVSREFFSLTAAASLRDAVRAKDHGAATAAVNALSWGGPDSLGTAASVQQAQAALSASSDLRQWGVEANGLLDAIQSNGVDLRSVPHGAKVETARDSLPN